jgi:hypothetical protein
MSRTFFASLPKLPSGWRHISYYLSRFWGHWKIWVPSCPLPTLPKEGRIPEKQPPKFTLGFRRAHVPYLFSYRTIPTGFVRSLVYFAFKKTGSKKKNLKYSKISCYYKHFEDTSLFLGGGDWGLKSASHLQKQGPYCLNYTSSPFCSGYFRDGVLQTIYPGWPWAGILQISGLLCS